MAIGMLSVLQMSTCVSSSDCINQLPYAASKRP